ncbi:MAG: leucine ABC transporter subunit substrate-binding protein LivK, partial [Bordetella trematum]
EGIVKAFKDAKRDPDGAFQMPAYAAVQVLADSIGAVGEDPNKVADHMHKTGFDTAIGKVDFDAKGDLKDFEFAVFKWDKDGKKTQL